jgi:hypothetical protein
MWEPRRLTTLWDSTSRYRDSFTFLRGTYAESNRFYNSVSNLQISTLPLIKPQKEEIKNTYCGVFTPCMNCNIKTSSRDYATVDEAVFSPCRAEPWRVSHHVASPRLVCCQDTAINTWTTQEWGRDTWPRQQWRHESAVTQQLTPFSACQIKVYRRDWS